MKKTVAVILAVCFLLSFTSCKKEIGAYEFMEEFGSAYPIGSVLYSPQKKSYESGFIDENLFRKIYIFDGELPSDYAIFLNCGTESRAECGAFVCEGAAMREKIVDMCLERVSLVSSSESQPIILCYNNMVFYSTLADKDRAERLFYSIIK